MMQAGELDQQQLFCRAVSHVCWWWPLRWYCCWPYSSVCSTPALLLWRQWTSWHSTALPPVREMHSHSTTSVPNPVPNSIKDPFWSEVFRVLRRVGFITAAVAGPKSVREADPSSGASWAADLLAPIGSTSVLANPAPSAGALPVWLLMAFSSQRISPKAHGFSKPATPMISWHSSKLSTTMPRKWLGFNSRVHILKLDQLSDPIWT